MIRRSASVSRKALILFVVVATLAFAQLAWWIIYQVEQAESGRAKALAQADEDCLAAATMVRLRFFEWGETILSAARDRRTREPRAGRDRLDVLREQAGRAVRDGLFESVWLESAGQTTRLAGTEGQRSGTGANSLSAPRTRPRIELTVREGRPTVRVRLPRDLPELAGDIVVGQSSAAGLEALVADRFPHCRLGQAQAGDAERGATERGATVADQSTTAAQVVPGVFFVVPEAYRSRLELAFRRPLVMFATEGIFFCLVIVAGVFVIVSTLRQEVALKHRQANFVSAVSHELKSPLASLRLHLQTLQMRELTGEHRRAYLGRMEDDVGRLEMLTRNLLAAARMEGRGPSMSLEPRDLAADVRRILEAIRPGLEHRQATLREEIGERIAVLANPEGIRSMVTNLIDNAVKYSGPDPEVTVRVQRIGRDAVLEVQDRGIGVARNERRRIFEAFFRVGDEMVREREGTGLGLYVVREVVTAHGGTVEVVSEGEGAGSTFRVRLPLSEEVEAAAGSPDRVASGAGGTVSPSAPNGKREESR